jgi:aromatic-L-amino-acid decarboxylase
MTAPHMSPEQFRELGRRMIDWIADYWERSGSFPVLSQVKPGEVKHALPAEAPSQGLPDWSPVFEDLERIILPGITHWQSPTFFGYFPANASGPGVLGELLSAGLGVQGMLWATSPACTELEERVMDWLVDALGLPRTWRSDAGGAGVIQGTASEAALVALVAARQRARRAGWNEEAPLIVYASHQAHSSIEKAAMVAGISRGAGDRERVRLAPVNADTSVNAAALERMIADDVLAGRWPCMVCATLGTTGTLGFDSIADVALAIRRAGAQAWLHVDAAHAGAACVCPEFRWMLDGADAADSFCFNPHKWLLTNFDCDCFWVREKQRLVDALSITPEYLRTVAADAGLVTDFRDLQVPLGRRFRALKLWFVIRHYGLEGLQAHIREHVRLAALLEDLIRADPRFELVGTRRLNLVCFRLRGGAEADEATRRLLERVIARGRVFVTHTVFEHEGAPRYVIRMAVGSPQTREGHVRAAWAEIQSQAG